ncbi:hypothetical protein ROJ8625_00880 [Roseivivax jejudonensis]|uniref:Type I secretion protein n=1 Tax=Roseivivax jejudonensis TaxID=1529041 RepID=A0A1X6YII5_9RHOB|nr:type I secretion protein [Roseivivax jejudonensis]SLN22608.1 hypothetical protein ROJ8625_00880 [Roseivivax jejudonensis]
MRAIFISLFVFGLCLVGGAREGAAADPGRIFVFGHSLVHHPDEPRTNVPYWLGRLGAADGREITLDGRWSSLAEAAFHPIEPQWFVDGITESDAEELSAYDTIVVSPINWAQGQAIDADYWHIDGNPRDAALALLDRIAAETPGAPLFLYEGWADMEQYGFPPRARGLRRYHAYNQGDYHAWFEELLSEMRAERPEARIGLIPAGPILSEIMTGPLSDLGPEVFYLDDAPHGTEETYLLAAAVTYAVLYDTAPPESVELPDTIAEELRAAWPEIAALIRDRVQAFGARDFGSAGPAAEAPDVEQAAASDAAAPTDEDAAAADTQPETEAAEAAQAQESTNAEASATDLAAIAPADRPLPERRDIALPPRGARPADEPALAFGLYEIADWSTQHPFVDLMKTARPWIGHLPGQWGGVEVAELRAGGHLDAHGWPLRVPEGVEKIEALILTDQPEAAEHLRGSYVVRYDGRGEIRLSGRAQRVNYAPGEARFHYAPGEGPVGIGIVATDPQDPIRNISVVQEENLPLHEAGALFNPLWLDRIGDARALRFMDWMATNDSVISRWEDRPRVDDYTWAEWGVPLPVMIALANRVRADPWFTLPHAADDAYVRAFGEAVRDGLHPELKSYVEYSNEVWNFQFAQSKWAESRAAEMWGESGTGWVQYYGLRAAQVMDIWTEVFGDAAAERLVRVVAVHTGWPGLEQHVLRSPLAFLTLGRMPQESFDAYAVTGYFSHDHGDAETVAAIRDWLDRAEAAARAAGEAEGLSRVALREYVAEHRFDRAFAAMETLVRETGLRTMTEEYWPYHGAVAREAELDFIMYEGGSHVSSGMADIDDDRLTDFLIAFNYSPEIAGIYRDALDGWSAAGGRLFNAFVDVAPPSKWGSWGALRHLLDANPRWDVLMAHNASAPVEWEDRAPGTFAGGVTRHAFGEDAEVRGTPAADVLLGGPGADILISGGGGDALHGGPGRDRAVLPGVRGDWRFAEDGPRLLASRGGETVSLVAVEEMVFADAPDDVVPTN